MRASKKTSLFACAAICLGLWGCGSKDDGKGTSSSTPSATTKPESSGKTASTDKTKDDKSKDDKTKDDKGDSADVDIQGLLATDDKKDDSSGLLKVDLSQVDASAPPIGGSDAKKEPATPPPGEKLEWIPAGDVQIGNPGWKAGGVPAKQLGFLQAPDDKAGLLFTPFTDTKDGQEKVDELMKLLQVHDTAWKKTMKKFVVGPDKLPALMGAGRGTDSKNKKMKLFYFLIQTGGKENLLAIGGVDDDAPEASLDTSLKIIDSIKKK